MAAAMGCRVSFPLGGRGGGARLGPSAGDNSIEAGDPALKLNGIPGLGNDVPLLR